jgi:hypothetical protein
MTRPATFSARDVSRAIRAITNAGQRVAQLQFDRQGGFTVICAFAEAEDPLVIDGKENWESNWDAQARPIPRKNPPQSRERSDVLLERGEPRARSSRLSGALDPFATRRHGSGIA